MIKKILKIDGSKTLLGPNPLLIRDEQYKDIEIDFEGSEEAISILSSCCQVGSLIYIEVLDMGYQIVPLSFMTEEQQDTVLADDLRETKEV